MKRASCSRTRPARPAAAPIPAHRPMEPPPSSRARSQSHRRSDTAKTEGAWEKPGATVIDVGINKITDRAQFDRFFAGDAAREKSFTEKGSTLVGDVDPHVAEVAGAITPVPGGVGPLTIAMLMVNTIKACTMRRGRGV